MLTLNILDAFDFGLTGVLLFLDAIVYWTIGQLFKLFTSLANLDFLPPNVYSDIVGRIEVVIGVVMLFFVASSLLKALVDPDSLSKNPAKIAKNCVISIVLLGVVPVIFDQAFKLQNSIIEDQVIEKLLFGNEGNTPKVGEIGNELALNILTVFLEVPDGVVVDKNTGETWGELKINIVATGDFKSITSLVEPIKSNEMGTNYTPLISLACGIFLIYVILSFCLDLGVRVVKLAFYQMIAPIPILMYIIPEKKSVFDNWVKATLATYLEVFIRLFVMFTVVFLAKTIF